MQLAPVTGSRAIGIAIFLYVALVVGASFYFNISMTPDRVIVLILLAGLGTGRVRQFLKDWSIFAVVILAWQVLQGLSGANTPIKPHVTEMINFDKLLFFGNVPTLWMQSHLYHRGQLAWYDVAATAFYLLHFVTPLLFAFVLWYFRRDVFMQFMRSFLVLALAGFATFVLFPAAPPWIAGDWHYIPHVWRILHPGIEFFGGSESISGLYSWMWNHGGWDLFGAVPSEHAAFPFLCFLYARKVWPRAGWVLLPYAACVWISVVYLGEHYVADVVVAVAYASLAYTVVQLAIGWKSRRQTDATLNPDTEEAQSGSMQGRLPA